MKKSLPATLCSIALLVSCTEETPRAELLEYNIGGKLYTYNGYAFKYSDYSGNDKQGFDWHTSRFTDHQLWILQDMAA